jgi:hypothetical protein
VKALAFIAVALLAAAVVPTASKADDPSAAQSAIDAVYKAQCAATVAGDADAWVKTVTPDYVGTDVDGVAGDFKGSVSDIREEFAGYKFTSCDDTITAVRQDGDNVIATVVITENYHVAGYSGRRATTLNQVDTWTNVGGAWLQKTNFITAQEFTSDGKVISDQVSTGTPPRVSD